MDGIRPPLPRALDAALRRAVLEHRASERRRSFAPRLHVGLPGGPTEVFAIGPAESLDHALRADVIHAMLARACRQVARPLLWLTRPGELAVQDVDAAWLAGAWAATAEAGAPLTLVVVTREGWLDPRTGVRRAWKRLRER